MRIPIAREGAAFVVAPLGAAVVIGLPIALTAPRLWPIPVVLAALAAACALFFRDPSRRGPDDARLLVAPADGRVTEVTPAGDGTGPVISIFLSLFDVHVNRAPAAGRVASVRYRPGEFRAAFRRDASARNEANEVLISGDDGDEVLVRQVAGVLARRIVCRAKPGDRLRRGERFGLIRFGSRTDVALPANVAARVRPGDRVKGGETVIGARE